MASNFESLGIHTDFVHLLKEQGIAVPTPIQDKTIPLLLAGKDVIAQAQTGTGKTLAFALPILQRIQPSRDNVQALIVTPTRELAIQIAHELSLLAPSVGASVLAAYGGQDVESQIRKLERSAHIVVATPGRLLDHLRRGTISLGKLQMLVLDEADQMLHMGFLPEVEDIISQTPRSRQTLLYSATIPEAVKHLAAEYLKNPEDVKIHSPKVTLDNIKQFVVETNDRAKRQTLMQLIELYRPYLAVVFCRTKVRVQALNEVLQSNGILSDELHGDLSQAKREQVMRRFRDARLQVLVATDMAARGLDVEGVTHVFNYDVPLDAEGYIHRIGRTGRAGQSGMAITLATPYDKQGLGIIEKGVAARLERRNVDGSAAAASSASRVHVAGTRDTEAGKRSGGGRNAGRRGSNRNGQKEAGFSGRGAGADRDRGGRQERAHTPRGKGPVGQDTNTNPWSTDSSAGARSGKRQGQARSEGTAGVRGRRPDSSKPARQGSSNRSADSRRGSASSRSTGQGAGGRGNKGGNNRRGRS